MSNLPVILHNDLVKLTSCLSDRENEISVGSVSNLVISIKNSCVNVPVEEKYKASICVHLFNETYGILNFLRQILIVVGEKFKNIAIECFEFIDDFLDRLGLYVSSYGPQIKIMCVKYLKNQNCSASVKRHAVITLSKVLELCKDSSNVEEMDIRGLMEDLILQLGLSAKFKLTQTVKEVVYSTLGVISHYYPIHFQVYAPRVLNIFLGELRTQMDSKSKSPEFKSIQGCLQGLKGYLYNFPVSSDEDQISLNKISDYAFRAVMSDSTDMGVNNDGLKVLTEHCDQFEGFLYDKAQSFYNRLEAFVEHLNRERNKVAFPAFIKILQSVAKSLISKLKEDKSSAVDTYNFFMQKFKDIFTNTKSGKLLTIAAVGCGTFAEPIKYLIGEHEVKQMLKNILQKSEHLFFVPSSDFQAFQDSLTVLPSFIEALAGISSQLENIPEGQLFALEKLIVFQIESYPHVPSSHRYLVPHAIVKILLAIQPKVEIFQGFLSQIIFQGIVRTCSHALVADIELNKDDSAMSDEITYEDIKLKNITYQNYILFWSSILKLMHWKELIALGISLNEKLMLKEAIYDEIISCVTTLYHKLDLSVENLDNAEDGDSDAYSDPIHGVQAHNMTDLKIFVNLVDFCQEFLKDNETEMFTKWVYSFARETIFFSAKHPLLSGFYKLVALNLQICSEIGYFNNLEVDKSDLCDLLSQSREHKEGNSSLHLFSKFSKDVVVRCQQFKDDLLASCLLVLLSLPTQIIQSEIEILIPALQNTFQLGLSYLPLAQIGLNTLEHWRKDVPNYIMQKHYADILPLLNPYLIASGMKGDKTSKNITKLKRSTKKVHKISGTTSKSSYKDSVEFVEESELMKIQLHIVRFLGTLGGEYNRAMLQSAAEKAQAVALSWDPKNRQHLMYPVPFVDMKPEIYLDDFLPHVLELATTSSDQQIKISACEVLHSLVLYIVGQCTVRSQMKQEQCPMDKLYKNFFPVLLVLASDVNQVAKQLFHPLVLQLIHWFTHRNNIEKLEAKVILSSLWDGATHQENSALRDFSSLCLKEYFSWSLRQADKNDIGKVMNVFDKMSSFARHPNSFKRLGACLVFNNIYRIYREDDHFVNVYTLELLVHFVESLAIAHMDDKLLGTQKECIKVLDHIERICISKSSLFLSSNQDRHQPVCLKKADIESVVRWLFQQCGAPQTECRHKCMELVTKLSPLISGVASASEFVKACSIQDQNICQEIFEQRLIEVGIPPYKTTYESSNTVIVWLEALITSLECFDWAITEQLLDYDNSLSYIVSVLEAVDFFIDEIPLKNLFAVMKHFTFSKIDESQFTPKDVLHYNWTKCTTLIRLFNFFITSTQVTSYNPLVEKFVECIWNRKFWEILIVTVVHPEILGFDAADSEMLHNLSIILSKILNTSKCQDVYFKKFCDTYLATIENYKFRSITEIDFSIPDVKHLQVNQLLAGYRMLIEANIWPYQSDHGERKTISQNLLNTVFDRLSQLQNTSMNPQSLDLVKNMFLVCDTIGIEPSQLLSKIFDQTRICNKIINKDVKLGIVVFSLFEKEISQVFCKMGDVIVPELVVKIQGNLPEAFLVLIKFLTNVAENKDLRKTYGITILKSLMNAWNDFYTWFKGNAVKHNAMQKTKDADILDSTLCVIEKIILIDSEAALNGNKKYENSLFPIYMWILNGQRVNLQSKIQTLDFLPFFISVDYGVELKSCLENIIVTHFPISCDELTKKYFEVGHYTSAIKKLLSALELTESEVLLEVLTVLFCKEENHFMLDNFLQSLTNMFKKNVPANRHRNLVEAVFCQTKQFNTTLSYLVQFNIMDHVCLTMLRTVAKSAFINFYEKNIIFIMDIIKQRKTYNRDQRNGQLVAKIGAFKLMELLYSRLDKDQVHSSSSQVVAAYVGAQPENGKELTQDVTKYALEFRKEDSSMEHLTDWSRILCCACFNTLIAVVSCTQTELKFFQGFIFKENVDKGERIWENIVDVNKVYKFDVELDKPLVRKKKFVSIRHHIRRGENEGKDDYDQVESSLHMMASQNLNISSLAEDAGKFDFSTTEQIFTTDKRNALVNKGSEGGVREKEADSYIELEEDDLNKHECMAQMTFLVKHMKALGLIPSVGLEIQAPVPMWLKGIVDLIDGSRTPLNVKLFWGRIITSNSDILKPYAKFLLKPTMSLIVSNTLGCEINYYILDVIVAILSWAPSAIPEDVLECHEATALLKFLVEKCCHTSKDVFRNNLEVIKTVLECWKDKVDIPYKSIFGKMVVSSTDSKDSVVGIQLLGVVLTSNLAPFSLHSKPEEQMSYFNILISNLDHKLKEIYSAAAEVLGLILKYNLQHTPDFKKDNFYRAVVNKLFQYKDRNNDKFIICLHIIHGYCPSIVQEYLSRLLYMQPKIHGVYQNYILEMLSTAVNDIDNGYTELKQIKLFEDIEHKEESIQFILLQTLERVVPQMSYDEILRLLPKITKIHLQPAVQCRLVLFRIMMHLYDKCSNSTGVKEKEILRICKEVLLKALADSDPTLKITVDNFWSNERLPSDTKNRLLSLIRDMYSSPTEDAFLQYATFLLLERTSHSPDFKRSIFSHPLSECRFLAYSIATSYRKRYAAMTPLFVDSSSFVQNSLDGSLLANAQMLKATQQEDFSQTSDPLVRSSTFNWLTSSSMDTFDQYSAAPSMSVSTFSPKKSHLFGVKKGAVLKTAQNGTSKPQSNSSDSREMKGKEKSSIWYLRRRFLKDKKSDSNVFARRELRRKDIREERKKEQSKQREAEVTMYRTYRSGDFPDIEIPNSAIIAPLQALAEKDAVVAKILLKSLMIAVCESIKINEPEAYHSFAKDISGSLVQVLEKSTENIPSVISFCLETLHEIGCVELDPEIVYAASIRSNQHSIGILLLESRILKSCPLEPSQKRRKQSKHQIEDSTLQWFKLAGLYKSFEDYDIANGVFTRLMIEREKERASCGRLIDADEETMKEIKFQKNRQAMQLEANGQYKEAEMLFSELYNDTSEEIDQAERDLWDNSILHCLDRLTNWDELESLVTSRFTDTDEPELAKIWDDPYYKDNYLPYLIKSKVKQLAQGHNNQDLLTFIDDCREHDDHKTYIEDHFFEELAMLYMVQENYDTARYYASTCISQFFKDWKSLSRLSVGMQRCKLQNLQKFIEMEEFLDLVQKGKSSDNFGKTDTRLSCLEVWQNRLPSVLDPPNVWDDIVTNRQLYINKLKKSFRMRQSGSRINNFDDSQNMETDIEDLSHIFSEKLLSLKLDFVKYCTIQQNMPVALMHLKHIHKDAKKLGGEFYTKFIDVYCFVHYKKSQCSTGDNKIKALLDSWQQLVKLKQKKDLTPSQLGLESSILELMADGFESGDFGSLQDEHFERVMELVDCDSLEQAGPILRQKCFENHKDVISLLQSEHVSNDRDSKSKMAASYLDLAKFCNKYLRQKENADVAFPMLDDTDVDYPKVLIESLLSALRYGSLEAVQFFPRLLQIIELYPNTLPHFVKNTHGIPCWMFIGWINQIVALLDKPMATAVQDIVENIIEQYPNAIIYSFYLSCNDYNFKSTPEGMQQKSFVDKMKRILQRDRLISEFIGALHHLSVPSVLFKDYVLEILTLIGRMNEKDILEKFNEMRRTLFDIEIDTNTAMAGPLQFKFSEMWKDRVLSICGEDGSKLLSASQAVVNQQFQEVIRDAKFTDMRNPSLNDISPWLSEFQSWKYSTHLEIPGQYTGKQKPLPDYHVKITGFDSNVLVLQSVALPRQITIRGNDEKEYKILVKCGEDLRQDSRIEQLFNVMNDIFNSDPRCQRRNMKLITYNVVPVTSKLGIIEWVDNTTVLKDFMQGTNEFDMKCKKKIFEFVGDTNGNPTKFYISFHKTKKPSETAKTFQNVISEGPQDLLKCAFMKLSSSPEAFLTLRTEFAVSHAVLCISHWLLGIGDRHTKNFLIDLTSGREIGIDFGRAFGFATQFQTVPELMPFRLTPQYIQLMEPLKEKGLIESTMVNALTALRNNHHLLLNIMDVFIKEPTANWKANAEQQKQTLHISDDDEQIDANWYPKQRVNFALMKLTGFNPAYIMSQELGLGHANTEACDYFKSACLGDPKLNVRAKLAKEKLSPEEQVSCLIDQATDPNILCKTYFGWNPWL